MRYSLKNILAPTDFSALAENAMITAIEMCKRHGTRLHIMHVIENQSPPFPPEAGVSVLPPIPEKEAEAKTALAKMAESMENTHGISVSVHLDYGNTVEAIGRKARELKCGLIIMGTHGSSGFREFFIGSTAFTLIKNTTIPVLTIPGKRKVKEFNRILFPIRAAKGIIAKFNFIEPVIKKNNAELFILGLSLTSEIFDIEDRKKELLQLGKSLGTNNIVFRSEFHVCKNYAKEVLKLAKKEKVNLIVIDAILDYDWTEYFIGPYVQQIVNHAQMPVLSIRTAEFSENSKEALSSQLVNR